MKPDDNHVCQPLLDDDGQVAAAVHGSPGLLDDPAAAKAMADIIAAARRKMADDDPDGLLAARQVASRERIRARLAMFRGRVTMEMDDGGQRADTLVVRVADRMAEILRAKPEQRAGQAAFNALYELDPQLADRIRGSAIDPFYRDERLNDFWVAIIDAEPAQ